MCVSGGGGVQNNQGRVLEDFSGVILGPVSRGGVGLWMGGVDDLNNIKEGLASFSHTVSLIYFLGWSVSYSLSLLSWYFFQCFFFFYGAASQPDMQREPNRSGVTFAHMQLVVLSVAVDVNH